MNEHLQKKVETTPGANELTTEQVVDYLKELEDYVRSEAKKNSLEAATLLNGSMGPVGPHEEERHNIHHAIAYEQSTAASALSRLQSEIVNWGSNNNGSRNIEDVAGVPVTPQMLRAIAERLQNRATAARSRNDRFGSTDGYEVLEATASLTKELADDFGGVSTVIDTREGRIHSPIDVAA